MQDHQPSQQGPADCCVCGLQAAAYRGVSPRRHGEIHSVHLDAQAAEEEREGKEGPWYIHRYRGDMRCK